jgi:hypothetical protein
LGRCGGGEPDPSLGRHRLASGRCIPAFQSRRAGCRPTGALGMAVLYRVLEGTGLQEALWMGRVMVFDEAADWNYGGSTCSKNAFECMFLPVTRHMRLLPYQHGPSSTQSTGRAYVLVPAHTLRPSALSCALLCSALLCAGRHATCNRRRCGVQHVACNDMQHEDTLPALRRALHPPPPRCRLGPQHPHPPKPCPGARRTHPTWRSTAVVAPAVTAAQRR